MELFRPLTQTFLNAQMFLRRSLQSKLVKDIIIGLLIGIIIVSSVLSKSKLSV